MCCFSCMLEHVHGIIVLGLDIIILRKVVVFSSP